ncbi:MAG: DNA polymerase IV, partial [Chitinophagaceae bacterium]
PGVGKHATEVLHAMGIFRISALQEIGEAELEIRFGKWGTDLWRKCQGISTSEVSSWHEAKSISTENTFSENLVKVEDIQKELVRQAEKVCYELRTDGMVAGCVAVKIRYPDFETVSKQTTVAYTSADDEIIPVLKELFKKLYKRGTPVRLLGVRLSDLNKDAVQTNLFSDTAKKSKLYKAVDSIKGKFGTSKVKRASGK